jgi:uncharacterized protein
MTIVSDSSPLIGLNQIAQLDLLPALFGDVMIPPAVADETARSVGTHAWLGVQPLTHDMPAAVRESTLGLGERKAIALAIERGADFLIVDDRSARLLAASLGLTIRGTAGVLVMAKEAGLLNAVRPEIDALLQWGFHFAPAIIEGALLRAGEV